MTRPLPVSKYCLTIGPASLIPNAACRFRMPSLPAADDAFPIFHARFSRPTSDVLSHCLTEGHIRTPVSKAATARFSIRPRRIAARSEVPSIIDHVPGHSARPLTSSAVLPPCPCGHAEGADSEKQQRGRFGHGTLASGKADQTIKLWTFQSSSSRTSERAVRRKDIHSIL
jgi:hypothetical protein